VRVLVLNPDLPVFPGRAGHEHLLATRLRALGHTVGIVSLVHSAEQHARKQGLLDAGVELYLWQASELRPDEPIGATTPPPARRGLIAPALRWLATGLRPADSYVQDFQFRNIAPAVLDALAARDWQVVVVVQSSCARWLDHLPAFPASALVLHDVRALLFERRAATRPRLVDRLFDRLEAAKYRRFEQHYAHRYDTIVTVSPADEAWVRDAYHPPAVVTVPIPVDAGYFAAEASSPKPRVVFTGMMDHPPNVDAACFFAREVWPGIRGTRPDAEFWIVGRHPTEAVRELGTVPGVVVTGLVPDIRPYIRDAAVVVVPLRYGSGMRNKILEAWAMEKCVVSTSVGAEGLDYHDRRDILIADDAASLGARVVTALQDGTLREQLAQAGRGVVARHDPLTTAAGYAGHLARTVERRRRTARRHTLVDLRWMRPGVAGGIENLSRSFLAELFSFDRVNAYTLLLPSRARFEFDLRRNPNVTVRLVDGPAAEWRKLAWRLTSGLRRSRGADNWRSPEVERLRFANRVGADLALSIPGYIHPDLFPFSNVLVVPDIQHEECPEFFSPEALDERRRIYRDAIARARHLVAISEFTGRSLTQCLGVPPEKVTVAPLAADALYLPGSPARGRRDDVLRKYGLTPGRYFLFPGNTWPHKNHGAAIEAMRRLRQDRGAVPTLVCTGAAKEAQELLDAQVRNAGLESDVRFLGYCPAADLPGLYEGASALLFPSLYEGFGMPVLEAMWCDCPVVCSDCTSLPEIAGGAALLVSPRDPDSIAAALGRVMDDEGLRRDLVERGRLQASRYSWRRFALTMAGCLSAVYESKWE
jgi:glycosyltransferase involved in cell wall biosynthesis